MRQNSLRIGVSHGYDLCALLSSMALHDRRKSDFAPVWYDVSLHETSPNALFQFEYSELRPSATVERSTLKVRDDQFYYSQMYTAENISAETAVSVYWSSVLQFSPFKQIMSDGSRHFKNETSRVVSEGIHKHHHYTIHYFPWSMEAINGLKNRLLRISRMEFSELQRRPENGYNWYLSYRVRSIKSLSRNVNMPHK